MQAQYHTRGVDPADRVDYWCSAMQEMLGGQRSIQPTGGNPFEAAVGRADVGRLQLVEVSGTPFWTDREGPGRAGWASLVVQLDGQIMVAERRRQAQLGPGDICLVAPDDSICMHRQTAFRQVMVEFPIEVMNTAWPGWRELTTQRLEASHQRVQAVSALVRYVAGLGDYLHDRVRDSLGEALTRLVEDLGGVVASQRRTGDGARNAARLRRSAEDYIREQLHDPALDLSRIATHVGVSTRYLHRLFADGLQVMQWVQEQRLQACRRELVASGSRPVAEVAWAWGFTSPAHFSRVFKKRFGVSPSAARSPLV